MASEIKVGSNVFHVGRRGYGVNDRVILQVTIVKETKHYWVDNTGDRWRKDSLARVPQYGPEPRYIVTRDAFAVGAKP